MNKILFVDDEALILNSLKRGLMDEAYEKFFATNGEEALNIMADQDISVLVTDMKMPGMTGLDLLKKVKELYPDMVKIVLSGYTQLPQVLVTVNQGDIFKFVTKPWDLENELISILREAVDYYNYRVELKNAKQILEKKNVTFQNILKTYDDKIIAIKEELIIMRDLNAYVFKENEKAIKHWDPKNEHKDILLSQLAVLNNLMIEAFSLVPFSNRRFSSKLIVDEFKKYIVVRKSFKHVEISLDGRMQTSFKGPYDLLHFMIKKIFEIYFIESYDTKINIVITGTDLENNEYLIRIIMKSEKSSFIANNLMDTVQQWLQKFIGQVAGDISYMDVSEGRAIILTLTVAR